MTGNIHSGVRLLSFASTLSLLVVVVIVLVMSAIVVRTVASVPDLYCKQRVITNRISKEKMTSLATASSTQSFLQRRKPVPVPNAVELGRRLDETTAVLRSLLAGGGKSYPSIAALYAYLIEDPALDPPVRYVAEPATKMYVLLDALRQVSRQLGEDVQTPSQLAVGYPRLFSLMVQNSINRVVDGGKTKIPLRRGSELTNARLDAMLDFWLHDNTGRRLLERVQRRLNEWYSQTARFEDEAQRRAAAAEFVRQVIDDIEALVDAGVIATPSSALVRPLSSTVKKEPAKSPPPQQQKPTTPVRTTTPQRSTTPPPPPTPPPPVQLEQEKTTPPPPPPPPPQANVDVATGEESVGEEDEFF